MTSAEQSDQADWPWTRLSMDRSRTPIRLSETRYTAKANPVNFNMFGRGERRFYPKVVRKAEPIIQAVLDAADFPIAQDYAAEFDDTTDRPTLTHRFNNKLDIQEVLFGTQQWEPGKSTDDAVNQIASVLVLQFPDQPLTTLFTDAGFEVGPARKRKNQLPHDDYEDAAVFITSDLSIDHFFKLLEEIDQLVADSGLGNVSGSGGGIGGWCIDLTALSIVPCIDFVRRELQSRNLEFHVSNYAV